MQDSKSLSEYISEYIKNPTKSGGLERFAGKIVDAASNSDPAALKQVLLALEEVKFYEDEQSKFTDEQIKNIICLASDRIRRNQ